jgi:transcriptional regulator with XRE-family HTH domain
MAPTSRLIDDLKAARLARGFSQGDVAARMGTTQSAVARLETNADPRLSTIERYARALGVDVAFEPGGPRLAQVGELVGEALARGAHSEAFRLLVQFLDNCKPLTSHELIAAVSEEPAPTGSANWDAFIGGLAEHVCVNGGARVPGWTAAPSRFLGKFWFVVEEVLGRPARGLAVYAFVNSPAALANRGVFVDEESLESV